LYWVVVLLALQVRIYLAQQGASVTVLDRQAGPAEETSFR